MSLVISDEVVKASRMSEEGNRLNEERLQAIKDQMAAQGVRLTNDDLEGLRSYLATEQQWQEVYRRLAESR